jgi:hypothetical protein
MIDELDNQIAQRLTEKHNYPYAKNIYVNIFKKFSHFPIKLSDLNLVGAGNTISFIALVVLRCFNYGSARDSNLYENILKQLKEQVQPLFPQDITVETYLGTILFLHNPINIKNELTRVDTNKLFDSNQKYEYELKKKTILLYAL